MAGIIASAPNTTADEMMFRMGSLREYAGPVRAISGFVEENRIIAH